MKGISLTISPILLSQFSNDIHNDYTAQRLCLMLGYKKTFYFFDAMVRFIFGGLDLALETRAKKYRFTN